MQTKIAGLTPVIQNFVKKLSGEGFGRIERHATWILLAIGGGYLLATVLSALLMSSMLSTVLSTKQKLSTPVVDMSPASAMSRSSTNIRDVAKVVKERNLFNSEGKFPEEKFGEDGARPTGVFDINAPCKPTTLPIELQGTIYLGDSARSFAIVKDKGYSEADTYKVGQDIIGAEGAVVAAIERQSLVINNNGSKECLDLNKPMPGQASDGFPSVSGADSSMSQSAMAQTGGEVMLESSYVESELGPGFAKIIDAARFVPNTVDNGTNGFKVFSIKSGSILSRIGLQNNDVITQVNDTSLKNPDQGFAFYQALQDEKEVRLQILRGQTPVMITVRIK